MASRPQLLTIEARQQPRDEVHYRTRGRNGAGERTILIVVNTSVGGFMARTDDELEQGERVTVTLPVVGEVGATIRWALGGRIGCQFDRVIDQRQYDALLAALPR